MFVQLDEEDEEAMSLTDLADLLRSERDKEQRGQVLVPDAPVSDSRHSQ